MDEPFVDSSCPYCSQPLSFPRSFIGTLQECPNCPEVLIVAEEGAEVGRKLPIPIQTSRLVLRPLRGADAEDLVEIMPDEASVQYTASGALDVEQAQDWIERAARVLITQPGGILSLAAELPEANRVIGLMSIFFLDEARKQIGFTLIIAPGNRKQGFGSEATGGVLKFAFEGLNLHRVTAECDSRNAAARRLLEKAGLRREGESVQSRFQKGEWINETRYAALLTDALQVSNRS